MLVDHGPWSRVVAATMLALLLGILWEGRGRAPTHDATSPGLAAARSQPIDPPARICGNASVLRGRSSPPSGAVVVPAGDNSTVDFGRPHTIYWFAPGVHTLGTDRYAQIIPGDGASFIGGPGAVLDGMNRNVYAFGQTATNVVIRHLTIRNFGTGLDNHNEGVVNHDAADGWLIERNTISDNDGAGVFVGDDNVVRSNCLRNNGQYGLSAYSEDGVSRVVIDHNEIVGNNVDDWESRIEDCGCTGGAKLWEVNGAVITDNWIRDNHGVGLWADTNNRNFVVVGNLFEGNEDEALWYELSYNATIRQNSFVRNTLVKGRRYASAEDDFPVAAVFLSESGGDARVDGLPRIDVSHNRFEDNWGGITLWENSDRFCGSPANTSTGSCTLGGPASLSTCVAGTIESEPYRSDCRWKTQNVHVHDNEFSVEPATIGCGAHLWCARSAVVSNYGTFPTWSPYRGDTVQEAITFHQNNRWYRNEYVGPWRFQAFEPGRTLSWAEWRAAPYEQDTSSSSS